jgi:hypothetical protein
MRTLRRLETQISASLRTLRTFHAVGSCAFGAYMRTLRTLGTPHIGGLLSRHVRSSDVRNVGNVG